jgi:FkbM family methyltransferase
MTPLSPLRTISRRLRRLASLRIIDPQRIHVSFERHFLRKFLSSFDIDCVFDVGANRGQYATRLLRKVGFRGHVISFEPTPGLAEILRTSAKGWPRWHIEECALGTTPGTVRFQQMQNDQFNSLYTPRADQAGGLQYMNNVKEAIAVEMRTLEDVYSKWKHILGFKRPFLKMDTQGNDVEVVRSGLNCAGEFIGLQSELAFETLYENTPAYAEALKAYRDLGFVLSAMFPNNSDHFPYLIEMDCVMVNRNAT